MYVKFIYILNKKKKNKINIWLNQIIYRPKQPTTFFYHPNESIKKRFFLCKILKNHTLGLNFSLFLKEKQQHFFKALISFSNSYLYLKKISFFLLKTKINTLYFSKNR